MPNVIDGAVVDDDDADDAPGLVAELELGFA